MRDEHDAQDIVQEAFLRALRHYDPYTVADARAWLLTIVRNCCHTWIGRQRADARTVAYDDHEHAVADPAPDPEERAVAREEREALRAAIDALPAEFREVIILREVQQMSYREISQVAGIPVGTVMSRLARARLRLQRALRGTAGPDQ